LILPDLQEESSFSIKEAQSRTKSHEQKTINTAAYYFPL
jgi:hypothetical protein